MSKQPTHEPVAEVPAVALKTAALILASAVGGAMAALALLPRWLPGVGAALGAEPTIFWMLSRSSGLVAYVLLWLSMLLGLSITNRLARIWPGGPVAFDLHQHTSLLGLGFASFHGLILIGDTYIGYTLARVAVPFATGYRPLAVGLGQLGLYLMALVALSFYARRWIGQRGWRAIHTLSFAMFGLALLHGLFSGSDTGTAWGAALYWTSGGSVLFLTIYRLLASFSATQQRNPGRSRP